MGKWRHNLLSKLSELRVVKFARGVDVLDVLLVCGCVAIVRGVWLIYPPVAWVVAGVLACVFALRSSA